MSFSIRTWVSTLALSFALVAGGCRNKQIPRAPYVPPVIFAQTIQNSTLNTDTGTVSLQDGALFRDRLSYIVNQCDPRDLQTLKDHNVTIALDQRLSTQAVSFFYPTAEAAYYRQGDSAVLSIWDDGKRECMDNLYYLENTREIVALLAAKLRSGAQDTQLYAGRFKDTAGEKKMEWRTPLQFSKKTLKHNMQLLSPPPKTLPGWVADQALLDKINPPVIHPTMKELQQQLQELKQALQDLKQNGKSHEKREPASTRQHHAERPAPMPNSKETEHQDIKPLMNDLKQNVKELKQQSQILKENLKKHKELMQGFKEARKKRKADRQNSKKKSHHRWWKHQHKS